MVKTSSSVTKVNSAKYDLVDGLKLLMVFSLIMLLLIFSVACSSSDGGNDGETSTSAAFADNETSVDNETSSDSEDPDESESTGSSETTDQEEVASFDADDLRIVVDDSSFTMLEDAAGLLSLLGDDYQYSEAESCVFEGMDKTFDYGDLLVYTVPSGDIDLLDGYDIIAGDYTTTAGIGLGSTRDEVLAAYGDPADDSDYMIYNESGNPENIGEPRLTIVLGSSGDVEMISYYSGSNAQE